MFLTVVLMVVHEVSVGLGVGGYAFIVKHTVIVSNARAEEPTAVSMTPSLLFPLLMLDVPSSKVMNPLSIRVMTMIAAEYEMHFAIGVFFLAISMSITFSIWLKKAIAYSLNIV